MTAIRENGDLGQRDHRLRRFFGFAFAGTSDFGTRTIALASLSNASNPFGFRPIALCLSDGEFNQLFVLRAEHPAFDFGFRNVKPLAGV